MKRGEVWIADLAPRSGSEQQDRRPVVLIGSDGFNLTPSWASLIVVPVSSSTQQSRRSHTTVLLPAGTGGLKLDSFALCHQITTLDRRKFVDYLGELPAQIITQIEGGIKAALDFPL